MTKTQIALKEWHASARLLDNLGRCCFRRHAPNWGRGYHPDNEVCARENAWRNYVRLRDNNPLFPFVQKEPEFRPVIVKRPYGVSPELRAAVEARRTMFIRVDEDYED